MTERDDTLLEFPCDFPIKAMGPAVPEFQERVLAIVRRHAPELPDDAVETRASRNGRYVSMTFHVHARDKAQLDAIYQDLTGCELVTVAL